MGDFTMSEDINLGYQVIAEHALQDAIDLICEYASGEDLSNIAEVCKSWRAAALREKQKRNFIQQLRFTCKSNNLTDILNSSPAVSLLFYESAVERSLASVSETNVSGTRSSGYGKELLEIFKEQLPNLTIMLKVDRYLSTEDEVFQKCQEQCVSDTTDNSDILGLFLPNKNDKVQVQVTLVDPEFSQQGCPADVINEFHLDNFEYNKTTIILITHNSLRHHNFLTTVICCLGRRAEKRGKEITWGYFHGKDLALSNSINYEDNEQPSVWLNISGPTVESWSTCINGYATLDQIESELHRLKEQVKRKRHYTGLLQAPSCDKSECNHNEHPIGDSHRMMRLVKRTFPDIPFTGFFVKCPCYGKLRAADYEDYEDPSYLDYNGFKNMRFESTVHLYISIIILAY